MQRGGGQRAARDSANMYEDGETRWIPPTCQATGAPPDARPEATLRLPGYGLPEGAVHPDPATTRQLYQGSGRDP